VQIYANVLFIGYSAPPNIHWDTDNADDDFVDNPNFESFNADFVTSFIYAYA
jgi:hypothetical protein